MAVVGGQAVSQGQPIGSVGNSSYRSITPHLHFEIRQGAGYPGNIRAVPGYDYAKGGSQSMKSNNCGTQQDPAALCGSGKTYFASILEANGFWNCCVTRTVAM